MRLFSGLTEQIAGGVPGSGCVDRQDLTGLKTAFGPLVYFAAAR